MYGKFFESAFTGSMVGSGAPVFAVWGYVIAHARPPGMVEINPLVLATMIGCKEEEIERAIDYLTSPDPNSRSDAEDGRRMIKMGAFLYSVPNWQHYQALRNDQERRAYNAEAQRRHRIKLSNKKSLTVIDKSALSAHVDVDVDVLKEKSRGGAFALNALPDNWKDFCKAERPDLNPEKTFFTFRDHWLANANQRNSKKANWYAAWRNWVRKERVKK